MSEPAASPSEPPGIKAWVLAARPKTLPAAVAPVWLGSYLGYRATGEFKIGFFFLALGSCVALQIATNLFNDALDFKKGTDNEERIGPKRATASGWLSPNVVMLAALGVLFVAGMLALPLLIELGWPILAIGIPSLFLCFGYTGGPFPLAYKGMGEIFVVGFFGLVAVGGTYFIQTGTWNIDAVVLGLQVGFLSAVLIEINNLRDVEGDAASGKRTAAVRFGASFGHTLLAVFLFGVHMLGFYWITSDRGMAFLLPLFILPLGIFIGISVFRTSPSPAYNRFLALSALHLVLFTVAFTLGLK